MKYNKSQIMKTAWGMYRLSQKGICPLSFADCLRYSWQCAKEAAAKKAEFEARKANKETFHRYAEMGEFSFKLWENYGKRRIYVNGNRKSGKGYIDLADNSIHCTGLAEAAARDFLAIYEVC